MKLEVGNFYKNRAGCIVRIVSFDDRFNYYRVNYIYNSSVFNDHYTVFIDGCYSPGGSPHARDLIELVPISSVTQVVSLNNITTQGLKSVINDTHNNSTLIPPEPKQTYSYSTEKYDEYADKYLLD